MPEPNENTPQAGAGTPAGQSPANTQQPAGQVPGGAVQDGDQGDDQFDPARYKATLDKLRGEIRDLRGQAKRATELEAKVKEYEQAKLSETEKLQARVKDYEATIATLQNEQRETVLRSVLAATAREAGMLAPDVAYDLADRALLEYGQDGKPTADSLKASVEGVRQRTPQLFSAQAGSGQQPTVPDMFVPRGDGGAGAQGASPPSGYGPLGKISAGLQEADARQAGLSRRAAGR